MRIRRPVMPLAIAGLFIVAALASVGLAARVEPMVTWLDVGSPGDEAYTKLFFPPESNDVETFRWTADHAELTIPVSRSGAYRARIKLATVRPEGRTLTVSCSEQTHPVDLMTLGPDSTVAVECQSDQDYVSIQLDVPVVYLPDGGRPLGVSIRDIQLIALDTDDRRAFTLIAALSIFGSITGLFLAGSTFFRSSIVAGIVPAASVFVGWAGLIDRYPEAALSALSGPGGLLALIAGLTTVSLVKKCIWPAVGLATASVAVALLWPQPEGNLVLESRWVLEELAALPILPWLAVMAMVAAVLLRGERAHWLTSTAVIISALAIIFPAIAARNVETRLVEITVPDWAEFGGVAGAMYVSTVFLLTGAALIVARHGRLRPVLSVTTVVAIGIFGLLLWRVPIMRFNGDEPHYYTTAWSIANDHDLQLLNNYVSSRYQTLTYSPVGNIALDRDTSAFRYAAGVSGSPETWVMLPDLPENWLVPDGMTGLIPGQDSPIILTGPNGAIASPPPLRPATSHAVVIEGPCQVESLVIGQPDGQPHAEVQVTILDGDSNRLWDESRTVSGNVDNIEIPQDLGVCAGNGRWTIRVTASQTILFEVLDWYNGLQIAHGELRQQWLFGGLPRDRYGSVDVSSRLVLHNPSDRIIQTTVRLITASDQTTSEITIGLGPGNSTVEPLPIFGATAVSVRVTEEVKIAAGLYAIVDGSRYRIPPMIPLQEFEMQVSANPNHDAGIWLTIFNPRPDAASASIITETGVTDIKICPFCAVVRLETAGEQPRSLSVMSPGGNSLGVTAVAYEERTGKLHYDIGLPLIAAPLTLFESHWTVLLVTAFAAIILAPGLLKLCSNAGMGYDTGLPLTAIVVMLAPISTYAVRFYTDLVAATLLVWGLVLWDLGKRSNLALAGAGAIAISLPILHGRLVVLAAILFGLVTFTAWQSNRERLANPRLRFVAPVIIVAFVAGIGLFMSQYAVALGSRGVGNFFRLSWVMPNSTGMLLDRGSGVLPFAPWVLFALAVPRPLHRTQQAALLMVIVYYALLVLRAGGWQTWGSPIRYLLPVVPMIALLAIPGMARLWHSGSGLNRFLLVAVVIWSGLTTAMLHWLPLAGYIDRSTPGNHYLIDDALAWLPVSSPFRYMPTIEALPGPAWGEPIGVLILLALIAAASWTGWQLVRESMRAPEAQSRDQ